MRRSFFSFAALAGVTLGLAATMFGNQLALAYAPEGTLLETKGYSPSLINTITTQRNRQEWRQPEAPKRSPMGNAMHNIYNNDWIGSFDDFGSRIIREQ